VGHIEQIGEKSYNFLNFIDQSFFYHPKGCTSYVTQI